MPDEQHPQKRSFQSVPFGNASHGQERWIFIALKNGSWLWTILQLSPPPSSVMAWQRTQSCDHLNISPYRSKMSTHVGSGRRVRADAMLSSIPWRTVWAVALQPPTSNNQRMMDGHDDVKRKPTTLTRVNKLKCILHKFNTLKSISDVRCAVVGVLGTDFPTVVVVVVASLPKYVT